MGRINDATNALRLVLSNGAYLAAFLLMAVLFFIAYGYLISSSSINIAQPKLALGLNIYSLAASAIISTLFSLAIVVNVFAFARNAASSGKLGLGAAIAAIAAIVPSSLCCSTLIPSLLAVLGSSTSTIISTSGALQGPFATYETPLIAVSAVLLVLGIFLTSRNIAKCCIVRK